MSAYNILSADIRCPNCLNTYKGILQFKFGDTWQFQYNLGDKISWGGNDIGIPNKKKVKVYGILENESCPVCCTVIRNTEYDILIENDVIKQISETVNLDDYMNSENDSFKIIKD